MRIVKSSDGSFTAYNEQFDECYHNIKDGALKESLKKHVEPAFENVKKDNVKILDICFGLGYNSLATIYYIKKMALDCKLEILSPEIDENLIKNLKEFEYPKEFKFLKNIINSISEKYYYEDENIKIKIFIGDARKIVRKIEKKIDIVYQDPFSPKKNPHLWTVEYFKDIAKLLDKDGIITTYSIASPVRFALAEAGFRVYEKETNGVKKQTLASFKNLPYKEIDIIKKRERSNLEPLRDKDVKKI